MNEGRVVLRDNRSNKGLKTGVQIGYKKWHTMRLLGAGCRVLDAGCWMQGAGCRVLVLGAGAGAGVLVLAIKLVHYYFY